MPSTEAEAIANLAQRPDTTKLVVPGPDVLLVSSPPGWSDIEMDMERYASEPRRPKGTVSVHDAASFTLAVTRNTPDRDVPNTPVYADEERMALVAVLNDDEQGEAGWRDHRVELKLRRRPEWEHWLSLDGKLVDQETFALHIEEGLAEIQAPPAADMLDLAQTISGATKGTFKGGARLKDGARAFQFEEEIEAKAGAAGTMAIPEEFTLAVRPFFGSDTWSLMARFRFQLRSGELSLGYRLVRPGDVERAAFTAVAGAVQEALSADLIAGVAPPPR
jgi:uncharacterized protein YfdQ (DUF2303 family)